MSRIKFCQSIKTKQDYVHDRVFVSRYSTALNYNYDCMF